MKKRVEAWAVVGCQGVDDFTDTFATRKKANYHANLWTTTDSGCAPFRVVRLVEADPLQREKDAVVRAAVRLCGARYYPDANGRTAKALRAAVARLKKKR